jgi:hypothetical protein
VKGTPIPVMEFQTATAAATVRLGHGR